jgi:NAD(P)-dependent dehydrogenase (short-subunit alcohol dehydrogenase family)
VELQGAVAVVTGAGSGIGRAISLSFAARGARVVVTDIREDRALAVTDELGDAAVAAACDVTDLADLEAARDLALERFGRVDVVVNNVGVVVSGPVEAIPLDAWQRTIDVNLMGVVRSNEVFLPGLLAQGSGHIVNVSSTSGLLPYPIGPDFPFVPVEACGELVADAIESGRFLVLTVPEVADDLRRLGADVDAYLRYTLDKYA